MKHVIKTPLHLGTPSKYGTHNCNVMNDGGGEPVFMVCGLPNNTNLEEVFDGPMAKRNKPVIDRANHVMACVNALDGLDPSAIPELVRAARGIVARLNHRRHGGYMTLEETAAYDAVWDAVKKVEGK